MWFCYIIVRLRDMTAVIWHVILDAVIWHVILDARCFVHERV